MIHKRTHAIKGVGLNVGTYVAFTDHMAPLCSLLDIPLLLTEEAHFREVNRLYPDTQTLLLDSQDLIPEYLIEHFDILFQSDQWQRDKFYEISSGLEQRFGKKVRHVHCPHGFSDKVFWLEQCVLEDITLVYGDNMLDMLRERGVFHRMNAYVRSGNYRYLYYLQHKAFYDRWVNEEILGRFPKKNRVILYAPTWNDLEGNTSFYGFDFLYDTLPDDYNLIVKLHPTMYALEPDRMQETVDRRSKKDNIVFLENTPLVFPLLSIADIYIGDSSSVGYDFLAFNRPMFFLNPKNRDKHTDRNAFLFRCGIEIPSDKFSSFYSFIDSCLQKDKELFFSERESMYRYTFGDPVSGEELKAAIHAAYESPKKPV